MYKFRFVDTSCVQLNVTGWQRSYHDIMETLNAAIYIPVVGDCNTVTAVTGECSVGKKVN
jgi:hypothetical protein